MIVTCDDCTESSPCFRDDAEPCWARRHRREELNSIGVGLDRMRRRVVNLSVGARGSTKAKAERAIELLAQAAKELRSA